MRESDSPIVLFLLGPSGVGKSSLGKYLSTKNWLHIEIDRYPEGDGIDLNNLRTEWEEYYLKSLPGALHSELKLRTISASASGCILTVPNGLVIGRALVELSQEVGISVRYLYGPAADCISTFLQREISSGRGLTAEHWVRYNRDPYIEMSLPELE